MRLKNVVILTTLLTLSSPAFGNTPGKNAYSPQLEQIIKAPTVKLQQKETKNGNVLEEKLDEHRSIIVTKTDIILILTGDVKGKLTSGGYSQNPIKAAAVSEDKGFLFLLREDGTVTVRNLNEQYEYDFGTELAVKLLKGASFETGNCGGWVYFVSTDAKILIWYRMEGEKLKFAQVKLDAKNILGEKTFESTPEGLKISVDGKYFGTVKIPK